MPFDLSTAKPVAGGFDLSTAKPDVQPRGTVPAEEAPLVDVRAKRPGPDISKMGMGAMGQTAPSGIEALQGPVTFPGAVLQGLAGGAARGMAGIIELGARAVGAKGVQRGAKGVRKAIPAGLAEYKEAYPISTGVSEFVGEAIAPTAALMKTGQALKAAGAAAPTLRRVLTPAGEALATGGFRTGLQPGVANRLTQLVGGATATGATQAMLTGDITGETGTAAGVGAALPIVLPALGQLGYKGIGKAIDYFTGATPQLRASEIAKRVAGPSLEEIRAATAQFPELSAGQAAGNVDRAAWQALAESAASKDPNEFVRILKGSQGQERLNALAQLAGGESQAASKEASKAAQKALNAVTGPMMETELKAAGTAGEFYKKAVPKMYQKYESMVDALQQSGQLYALENQTRQALLKKLNSPTPGWVSAKTIDQLEQNVLKARAATQEMNAMKWQRQDEGEFIRRQLDSLEAYGLKPIDTENIVRNISQKLENPKIGVSDENKKVLIAVADKIQEWTAKGGGYIDPVALHEIRKTSINEVIQKELAGRDPSYIKKQAAKVTAELRPLIDDAIEKAGGTEWRKALETHAAGMHKIDQQNMAAKAMQVYQQSPEKFVELVKGNSPDVVESVFGPGKFNIKTEMGDQYPALKRIADELERDIKIAKLATEGRTVAAEEVAKEGAKFRIPGLLSPKVTVANKTLDVLESRLNQKTKNALIEGMRTGKSANELLNMVPATERYQLMRDLAKSGQKRPLGFTVGAGQTQVERQ
jgi:hypothetical protein